MQREMEKERDRERERDDENKIQLPKLGNQTPNKSVIFALPMCLSQGAFATSRLLMSQVVMVVVLGGSAVVAPRRPGVSDPEWPEHRES